MTCKREGCTKWAAKDEFCSSLCAKSFFGTIGPPPKRSELERRRRVRQRGADYVELRNEGVNRAAHEGLKPKQKIRFTSG
jgi:hypothetical protein